MYSFIGGLVILVLGYMIYGLIVDKIFAPDDRYVKACERWPPAVMPRLPWRTIHAAY